VKKAASPKPTRKKTRTPRKPGQTSPGLIWMVAGLLVGLLVAFLVWLQFDDSFLSGFTSSPASTTQKAAPIVDASSLSATPTSTSATNTTTTAKSKTKPQPTEAIKAKPKAQPKQAVEQAKPTAPKKPTFNFYSMLKNNNGKSRATPTSFTVVIGTYPTQKSAQAKRAQLLLSGFTPTLGPYGKKFRLTVGPFDTITKATQFKQNLAKDSIDSTVVGG
jgi:cell division protein FtsN